MPAPTYFNSASNPADNGTGAEPTTLAVTPPGSMVRGDLVCMLGMHRNTADTITLSQQSGQSWLDLGNVGFNTSSIHPWWCEFNGIWGADPSLAFGSESGTIPVSVVMHVFRPAVVSRWVIDIPIIGAAEASASTVTIDGVTPQHSSNVTLAAWLIPNISTWGTLSGAGWAVTGSAQYRNSSGSDISAAFAHQLQDAAAATGNVSLNPSVAAAGMSLTVSWYALPISTGYQVGHRR